MAFGIGGAILGAAAIGAVGSIAGGFAQARAQRTEASRLREWQADQYARRYQITMSDMRAAGLNPMLAYSQGPGTPPSGAMANIGDFGTSAASRIVSEAVSRKAMVEQARAQTELQKQTAKTEAEKTRRARMEADDYRDAGDSVVGRQAISAVRMGASSARFIERELRRNRGVKSGKRPKGRPRPLIREKLPSDWFERWRSDAEKFHRKQRQMR